MVLTRSWSPLRLALAAIAATVTGIALATTLAADRHVYGRSLLWVALVLGSFVGWGALLNRWLARGVRLDWGLRAGWGFCFSILLGGYLCLAHLACRFTLVTQVAAGLAGLSWEWVVRSRRPPSVDRFRRRVAVAFHLLGPIVIVMVTYAFVVVSILGCFGDRPFQPSDDPALYLAMPQKLLQSGSLLEPFAARRMPILGGHVYLHALFLAVAPYFYTHVVDGGLCVALTAGLLIGHVKRHGLREWHIVPLALVLLILVGLRSVRVNTGSLYSGVVAIVTCYRTARVPLGRALDGPVWPMDTRRMALLGAATAATITLRSSLAGAALSFAGIVIASDFVRGNRRPFQRESLVSFARSSAIFCAAVILGVLPWSVLLHQSCGTFLYPFGHSNITAGLSFLKHEVKALDIFSNLLSNVFYEKPIAALLPFLLAGLSPLSGRGRNDLIALTLATASCLATLALSSFAPVHTSRYYFAAVAATALVTVASVERRGPLVPLAVLAVAAHIAMTIGDWNGILADKLKQADAAYEEKPADRKGADDESREYREVQSHVPPGATIVAAVRDYFQFDFHRNRVFTLDALGAMGPRPGWPAHQGSEALADYLHDNGVEYVIRVDFNEPGELYNREHWKANREEKGTTIAEWAVYHLDAEDALDGLSKVRRDVFAGHGMTVIDLTKAEPPKTNAAAENSPPRP